ncbi:hypothetical protein AB0F46_29220 [Streptomyces sp. NPDC026665]|uniref:hypothetical protein n=1 Tax=Streptomyces sp. NPDC026665 TaxID=3154798 RepID=UPI0033CCFF83
MRERSGGPHAEKRNAVRTEVNSWIRDHSASASSTDFAGIIGFDTALRDPNKEARLTSGCDSGDHLNSNDAGMTAPGRSA